MATSLQGVDTKTHPLLSYEDILRLCHAATGGWRELEFTGCIRIEGQDLPLCSGSEHDVTWITDADAKFTTLMSPYQVACLVREAESNQRRADAYAIMLREHGFDPNQALFPDGRQAPSPNLSPTDSELNSIETLCKRATPGPWSSTTGCGAIVHVGFVCVDKPGHTALAKGGFQLFEIEPDVYLRDGDDGGDADDRSVEQAEADVRFIAAMSPLNTLRLIAHIRDLKRQIKVALAPSAGEAE
jgi:hypothetical protein